MNPLSVPPSPRGAPPRAPIAILGVPFDNVTTEETVACIGAMIASRQPHYLATANVDFVVQALEDVELRRILFDAHLVLCDGMPLVWASRQLGNPLPERVTGSDLIPRLLKEAERLGWRVFFLGGSTESVAMAAAKTLEKHPLLQLVGAYSPPFKPLLEMDQADIAARITAARPDLLLVAFGCPKQEKWINMHYRELGVPVSVGVGATIDFLAGTFKRAPVWMQKTGTEWVFRMLQEPRRLARRYGKGFWIFGRAIMRQARQLRSRPRPVSPAPDASAPTPSPCRVPDRTLVLRVPESLDAAVARDVRGAWGDAIESGPLVLDLGTTTFVDSTGIGLLVRLRKRARELSRPFILAAPSAAMRTTLHLMKLETFFELEPSVASATARSVAHAVLPGPEAAPISPPGAAATFLWNGEITAGRMENLTASAEARIAGVPVGGTVTFDLSRVPFVDSCGVGQLVRLKKRAWQRDVKVVFSSPTPAVANVLRLTKLDEYLLGRKL